jgi:hypothetical protein
VENYFRVELRKKIRVREERRKVRNNNKTSFVDVVGVVERKKKNMCDESTDFGVEKC